MSRFGACSADVTSHLFRYYTFVVKLINILAVVLIQQRFQKRIDKGWGDVPLPLRQRIAYVLNCDLPVVQKFVNAKVINNRNTIFDFSNVRVHRFTGSLTLPSVLRQATDVCYLICYINSSSAQTTTLSEAEQVVLKSFDNLAKAVGVQINLYNSTIIKEAKNNPVPSHFVRFEVINDTNYKIAEKCLNNLCDDPSSSVTITKKLIKKHPWFLIFSLNDTQRSYLTSSSGDGSIARLDWDRVDWRAYYYPLDMFESLEQAYTHFLPPTMQFVRGILFPTTLEQSRSRTISCPIMEADKSVHNITPVHVVASNK